MIKNQKQIEGIKESAKQLKKTFDFVQSLIEPGISTEAIDRKLQEWLQKNQWKSAFKGYHGFPGQACYSVNEQVIHGLPSNRPLKNGDILSLDMGLIVQGYYSDSARTYMVGDVSSEKKQLLKDTQTALTLGCQQAVAGARVKDISMAIYNYLHPKGYGVVYQYCGHGVGIQLHEPPEIPNYPFDGPNQKLKAGMVIAIEPMVNLGTAKVEIHTDQWTVLTKDRKCSAHFEDMVYIGEQDSQILT